MRSLALEKKKRRNRNPHEEFFFSTRYILFGCFQEWAAIDERYFSQSYRFYCMANNCTDSSNAVYRAYWFDYFVSSGYLTGSMNEYAPYGQCTRSLLWVTYLINVVHFCLLSSGILYISSRHQREWNGPNDDWNVSLNGSSEKWMSLHGSELVVVVDLSDRIRRFLRPSQ